MLKWLKRLWKRTGDCLKASRMQRYVSRFTGTPVDQMGDSVIVSQSFYNKILADGKIDASGKITQKHIDEWGAWPTFYRPDSK